MHQNSIDAFKELGIHLSRRELEVLGVYKKYPRAPFTDRQIMWWLKYTDPNSCRPRITSLLKKGLLIEQPEKVVDIKTGRKVRLCKYHKYNPPQDFECPSVHPEAADG